MAHRFAGVLTSTSAAGSIRCNEFWRLPCPHLLSHFLLAPIIFFFLELGSTLFFLIFFFLELGSEGGKKFGRGSGKRLCGA